MGLRPHPLIVSPRWAFVLTSLTASPRLAFVLTP